jgi:hypothetical protein
MSGRLLALTVTQPSAWAICAAGQNLENRTWTWAEAIGQDVAIHAGKALPSWEDLVALDADLRRLQPAGPRVPGRSALPRGCIVAVARFGTPLVASPSPWFVGPFAWPLTELRVLAEPVPCAGRLGFWALPPDVLDQVAHQVKVRLWPEQAAVEGDLHALRGRVRGSVTDSRPGIRDERPGRSAWPRGEHPAVCAKYARGAA